MILLFIILFYVLINFNLIFYFKKNTNLYKNMDSQKKLLFRNSILKYQSRY